MSFFSNLRSAGSLPVEGHLPGFDGAPVGSTRPRSARRICRGRSFSSTSGPTPASTGSARSPISARGPRSTRIKGLVVVGVHTPEFPFERDVDNVRQAVKDMAVEYPVALDSDYAIWQAFANRFWPAVYIADAEGRIRHHQFGEGGYAECEMVIQRLLGESGRDTVPHDLVSIAPDGFEAQADWASLKSPETYLGYEQARGFASPGDPVLDQTHDLRRARPVESEPLGSRRGLDDRASGERTRPHRWPNPLPLPRPRHPPRHGTASARCFRAVPRTHRW